MASVSSIRRGLFECPEVHLHLAGHVWSDFPVRAWVESAELYAGAQIGSAVVLYPTRYARDADPDMGARAWIKSGGDVLFSGVVGAGPWHVHESEDCVRLVIYDDRWLISRNVVGQQGLPVATPDIGFPDVGFNVVFNADGKPNKDPAALTFNTGSTAVFWTLATILEFLFTEYVDITAATLTVADLSAAGYPAASYTRTPVNLSLRGQNALQAVDTVVRLSGESWALVPGATASVFRRVAPGCGTLRRVRLHRPKAGATVRSADALDASEITIDKTILNNRDVFQAHSAPIVLESTLAYNVPGASLLALVAAFKDKDYSVRLRPDVTAYAALNLGENLSLGSPPKRWLSALVTRKKTDDSGYLTAADIAAAPALANNPRAEPALWVAVAGPAGTKRKIAGGVRVDFEDGCVDLKNTIEVLNSKGDDTEKLAVDWSVAALWLTVATVLESREVAETAGGLSFLAQEFTEVIDCASLAPERRRDVLLPDLASADRNAVASVAAGAEEKYVDVGTQLADAVAAAIAASPDVETPLKVALPFQPFILPGDLLKIVGRPSVASGNEVAVAVRYNLDGDHTTHVEATNVVGAVADPDRFVQL